MGLFSKIERDDQGLARRSASQYAYLDRSARPEAYKVRSLIESWLDNYPIEGRTKLLGDLRSKSDIQHLAGFFELLIHQMYFQAGAHIRVEPELPDSTKRPDFLIGLENSSFYLEVTSGFELAPEIKAGIYTALLLDEIDTIQSDRFFVGIRACPITRS
jgi:hypothetical protein